MPDHPSFTRPGSRVTPLLSARQRTILEFVRDFHSEHHYAPTIREVAEAAGLESSSSAQYQLRQLQGMGWIRTVPGRPRAIIVLDPADGTGGEAAA